TRPSARSSPRRCRRELAHVSGAALASRSIVRRPEDSTGLYGLGPPDLGAWRQRRQPCAEPGSAGRERKAAGGVSVATYTREEVMAVEAARRLRDGDVCFVGIGLPSLAANLARATHAPNCVLIYESGTIGAKPRELPLSIGDGELAETADAVVSVPEVFAYWL